MKNTWILAASVMSALTLSSAATAGSLETPRAANQVVHPDGAVVTRQAILSDIIAQPVRTETVRETQTTNQTAQETRRPWGLGTILRGTRGAEPSQATRPTTVFPRVRAQNTAPKRGTVRTRFGISHGVFR